MAFLASLKNALDWLVASETFAGKPVALINTSPRAFHAQAQLTRDPFDDGGDACRRKPSRTLSLTGKKTTAEEILADPASARKLKEAIEALTQDGSGSLTSAIAPPRALRHMSRHES